MHWGKQRECFQWSLGSVVPADMHLGKDVGFELWDMALRLWLSVDYCWFKEALGTNGGWWDVFGGLICPM